MAAYPAYAIIGLDSQQDLENGWSDSISSSGTMHSIKMHGKQYYQFTLLHPALTGAQFETVKVGDCIHQALIHA